MAHRMIGVSLFIIALSAANGAAEDPSAPERTLFDNCMGNPTSTTAFCRCGVDYYVKNLSPRDVALMAAVSNHVAAGRANAFEFEANRLGLSSAEKGATLTRIATAAKGAVEACHPLIEQEPDAPK
jgi:hypothetical protein